MFCRLRKALATTRIRTLTVANFAPVALPLQTLPGGTNGVAYSTTLVATGGVKPYTWSLVSGSFQTGLSLSGAGVISGTPTATGTVSVTIRVRDASGTTGVRQFNLTVA